MTASPTRVSPIAASPRRRGRPPANERVVRSREELIEAALITFSARGYDMMSVRELTRQLGVSHSLVHHYFNSKRTLWEACIDHSFGPMSRELQITLANHANKKDPIELLHQIIYSFVRCTAKYPAVIKILMKEEVEGGERFDFIYDRHIEPVTRPWIELLQKAEQGGRLRHIAPSTLFYLVTNGAGTLFSFLPFAEKLDGVSPRTPEMIEGYAEQVADVLINGLARKQPSVSITPISKTADRNARMGAGAASSSATD